MRRPIHAKYANQPGLKYLSIYQAKATFRPTFPRSFINRDLFTRVNTCGLCFQSSGVVEALGAAETVVVLQLLIGSFFNWFRMCLHELQRHFCWFFCTSTSFFHFCPLNSFLCSIFQPRANINVPPIGALQNKNPGNWKYYLSVTCLSLTGAAVFRWYFTIFNTIFKLRRLDSRLFFKVVHSHTWELPSEKVSNFGTLNPPPSEVGRLNLRTHKSPPAGAEAFFLVVSHLSR